MEETVNTGWSLRPFWWAHPKSPAGQSELPFGAKQSRQHPQRRAPYPQRQHLVHFLFSQTQWPIRKWAIQVQFL